MFAFMRLPKGRYCSSFVGKCIQPKPFHEVPGPTSIPFLRATWKYLPLIGSWDVTRLHEAGAMKLAEFGPLVREEISSDLVLCHVFKAEDIGKVYKAEGKFPARRSHLALQHYRLTRPHLYNTGGLLPTNGPEWWRIRSAFQKHISPLNDVRMFLPHANQIISEFINTFFDGTTVVNDLLPLISRLYLELMWMYMFGKRLGSFKPHMMNDDSVPSKLIEAAERVNLSTLETDSTEKIWKTVKTPLYKRMEDGLQFIESIVMAELDDLEHKLKSEGSDDFLVRKYFFNSSVDRKDINGMTVDLLLGSVDTTSYTTCFLLYNLSKNLVAQTELRKEAKKLLSENTSIITGDMLNKAVHARAILKESFRLNPISIGVSRYLEKNTIFSGYLIPQGTLMMTQNLVACRNADYFPDPERFLPERWLRDSPHYLPSISPYLVLPFSHGPRTCIARRLSEQNLLTLLLHIGRKFSVEWLGDELGIITPLICKPDAPVKLAFRTW